MAQAWATGAWAEPAWAEGTWAQVGAAPVITSLEVAAGSVDVPYTFQFRADGDKPITWDVTVGAVPAWASLSSAGLLTGLPNAAATTNFTVRATNAQGTDTLAVALTVGTAATGTGVDRAVRGFRAGRGFLRLVGR